MQENTQPINRENLLIEANEIIRSPDDYVAGMHATSVSYKNGVLIFGGEYFLDEHGIPRAKSTAAFNIFKHLARVLSEKYHLMDE